jgi:hypothetical protein
MASPAGPVPQTALYNALSREQQRQQMSGRTSKDVLLDEEGIALDTLSHQRTNNIYNNQAGAGQDTRPGHISSQFQSSSNVAQQGWRRGKRDTIIQHDSGSNVLALGRLYQRMGKMSIIPRYIIYIVPVAALIAIPIVIGACIPTLELGVYLFSPNADEGCPDIMDIRMG